VGEHYNFRAALDHAENDQALRLVGEIWKFWEIRGHFTEGRRRIVEALARTDAAQPDDTRARALSALGTLAYTQGAHEAALTVQTEAVGMAQDASVAAKARNNLALTLLRTGRLEEAEQVFEAARADFVALGNRAAEAATLSNLGIVRRRRGDLVGARAALETAIQRNREAQSSQSLAFALNGLALVLIQMRCLDEAETCFAESLEIKRRLNDRAGVVSALANMGLLAAEQGRFARAVTLQREALALRIELGLQHGILESLSGFSLLAHAAGDSARAATLLGAQTAFGEKIGTPVPPEERADAETALRTALPESDFKHAFARGEAMTIAEATAFAAAFRPTDANGCPRL
jgi:tetratricopeptide (TPR) repeat protein